MLNRYLDVFRSLRSRDVKYVVMGGVAAILHGVPRGTFDLDILIEPGRENALRLLDAFLDAGLGTASLTSVDDLLSNEITVFNDRVRIDVQTFTPGVTFEAAWERRVTIEYRGELVYVMSRADVIASKRAAGRTIDLEDARLLELGGAEPGGNSASPEKGE